MVNKINPSNGNECKIRSYGKVNKFIDNFRCS